MYNIMKGSLLINKKSKRMGTECCSQMSTTGTKEQAAKTGEGKGAGAHEEEILAHPASAQAEDKKKSRKAAGRSRATPVPYFPTNAPHDKRGPTGNSSPGSLPPPSMEPLISGRPVAKVVGSDKPRIMHVHDVRTFLSHGVHVRKSPTIQRSPTAKVPRSSSPILQEEIKEPPRPSLVGSSDALHTFTFYQRLDRVLRQSSDSGPQRFPDPLGSGQPSGSSRDFESGAAVYMQYVVVESLGIDTFGESWKVQEKQTGSLHILTAVSKSVYELAEDHVEQLQLLQSLVPKDLIS